MTAEIDFKQFKDMFPLLGKVAERHFRRIQALRKLQENPRETDEASQLRKVEVKEMLSALVKLEEWK